MKIIHLMRQRPQQLDVIVIPRKADGLRERGSKRKARAEAKYIFSRYHIPADDRHMNARLGGRFSQPDRLAFTSLPLSGRCLIGAEKKNARGHARLAFLMAFVQGRVGFFGRLGLI